VPRKSLSGGGRGSSDVVGSADRGRHSGSARPQCSKDAVQPQQSVGPTRGKLEKEERTHTHPHAHLHTHTPQLNKPHSGYVFMHAVTTCQWDDPIATHTVQRSSLEASK